MTITSVVRLYQHYYVQHFYFYHMYFDNLIYTLDLPTMIELNERVTNLRHTFFLLFFWKMSRTPLLAAIHNDPLSNAVEVDMALSKLN